jgi:hypothetical protein
MSLFDRLNVNTKAKTSRKFISPKGTSCICWTVDKDGDVRLTITDNHNIVHFGDWIGEAKDVTEYDKKLSVLVDEINAMRKALKTIKK